MLRGAARAPDYPRSTGAARRSAAGATSLAWLAAGRDVWGGNPRAFGATSCSVWYTALAVAVLLMTVGALLLGLCMLVHFHRRHVADGHPSWKNAARAPHWKLVQDPLFQLWARVQSALPAGCCAKGAKHPVQRMTGGWRTARYATSRSPSCHFLLDAPHLPLVPPDVPLADAPYLPLVTPNVPLVPSKWSRATCACTCASSLVTVCL